MTREEILNQFKRIQPRADFEAVEAILPQDVSTMTSQDINELSSVIFDAADGASVRVQKLELLKRAIFSIEDFSKGEAAAHAKTAESYAVEPIDTFVKEWSYKGDGQFEYITTNKYSSLHYNAKIVDEGDSQVIRVADEGDTQILAVIAEGNTQIAEVIDEGDTQEARLIGLADDAELSAWEAEAEALTAASTANAPVDVLTTVYTSNGDGTFSETDSTWFSSFHWKEKAKLAASGLTWVGNWDASSGSLPPDGTETGQFYIVSVSGNVGGEDYFVGDWIIWDNDSTTWNAVHWNFSWTIAKDVTVDGALPAVGDDLARRSTSAAKGFEGRAKTWADVGMSDDDFAGLDIVGALTYIAGKLEEGQEVEQYVDDNYTHFRDIFELNQRWNITVVRIPGNSGFIRFEFAEYNDNNRGFRIFNFGADLDYDSGYVELMNKEDGILKTGGVMTGDLEFNSSSGEIILGNDVDINIRDSAGNKLSVLHMSLSDIVVLGAANKKVELRGSNITTAAIPTNPEDLTRKDYVDNGATPIGGIIMYSGLFADIPTNWSLCDGANGTPDLVDRFIFGTATEADVGSAGGSADAVVVEHSHSYDKTYKFSTAIGSETTTGDADIPFDDTFSSTRWTGSDTGNGDIQFKMLGNNVSTSTEGSSGDDANLPPYVKLAYIIRVS